GFPFGSTLGKSITVSTTTVSRLEKEKGVPAVVQVNGGMHPGNSGGPVTNGQGEVVGVAVAGIKGTTIHFPIAADSVHETINGRVWGIGVQPVNVGGQVKLGVMVGVVDPFKKIKQTSLEFWVGAEGPARDASAQPPAAQPGDSARQTVMLDAQSQCQV